MILSPSITLLIARHDDHDAAPSIPCNDTVMAGFIYPTGTHTTCSPVLPSQSVVSSSVNTPTRMTATAILPALSNGGSRATYLNTTSTECLSHILSIPTTSASLATASPVTSAWDALWSLHSVANSSITACTTTAAASNSSVSPSAISATHAIPYLTTRPAQPSAQSSTAIVIIPITTMTAVTLSSMQKALVDPSMFDPSIFDPGRLSSSDVQTSTIHITVTASVPAPTPTTTSLRESTITSKVTSTLTKTVRESSTPAQSSSSLSSVRLSSAPQSSLIPSSSSTHQSNGPFVHTSVFSKDPRCPYPLPGVYCGEPKTTLITETKCGEVSTTSLSTSAGGDEKSKEPAWCPYPGLRC